jgi:hypothetical protein
MKRGDIVRLYAFENDGRPNPVRVTNETFLLGRLSDQDRISEFEPGTLGIVIDITEDDTNKFIGFAGAPILLVDGKVGWAYPEECEVVGGDETG